jgi:hypothetical protein
MSLRDVERKRGNQTEEGFPECASRFSRASAEEPGRPFGHKVADAGRFPLEFSRGVRCDYHGTLGDADYLILLALVVRSQVTPPMGHCASPGLHSSLHTSSNSRRGLLGRSFDGSP